MQCPNCRRDNTPSNRYCTYCGSDLHTVEGSNEQSRTAEEIRRLRELCTRINIRLDALERRRESIESGEDTAATIVEQPQPAKASVSVPDVKPVVECWDGIATEPSPPPPEEPKPKTGVQREWEQILGGNWLARIGVLSLIIGAGFFLKFAFDRNWLGPTGRVILGILVGLLMLAGGHYWRRKYPTFAQTISGGGIALLYLSIFAAYAMFNLISFYPSVALLFVISVASAALALRYNSMALAIISIIGAFVAPFILAFSVFATAGATRTAQSIWLLVYIMVVDIGVLWLSTFRNWRWLTLIALIGSLAAFGVWYGRFGNDVSLFTSMGSLTAILLIFVSATMLYHLLWRRVPQAFDYSLMVINATAYYGISYALLFDDLRAWIGGFSFLLAIFYGGLAYLARMRGVANTRLAFFALGIALLFLTIAIPVQLGDEAWTTIIWATQGAILVWLSIKFRIPHFRLYSYIVFAATAVRLMFFDIMVTESAFTPVFNERFLAFSASIAAIYLAGYIVRRERASMLGWEEATLHVYRAFFMAANFFTILLLSTEVWTYFSKQIIEVRLSSPDSWRNLVVGLESARNLSLTALWAIYAVALLVVGIIRRWRPLRLAGLGLLVIPIIKVYVYDVFALQQVYRIVAFVSLGLLLIVSGYLYHRYREIIRGLVARR